VALSAHVLYKHQNELTTNFFMETPTDFEKYHTVTTLVNGVISTVWFYKRYVMCGVSLKVIWRW